MQHRAWSPNTGSDTQGTKRRTAYTQCGNVCSMAVYTTLTGKYKEETFMKYVCDVCGWVYDEDEGYPEGGIAPGTKWEDLPDDFECPLCGIDKDSFSEE